MNIHSKPHTDLEFEEKHLNEMLGKTYEAQRALYPAMISWMIRSFYKLRADHPNLTAVEIEWFREYNCSGHALCPMGLDSTEEPSDEYSFVTDELNDIGCSMTLALESRLCESSAIIYLNPLRIVQERRIWNPTHQKHETKSEIDLTEPFLEGVAGLDRYLEKPK